MAGESLTETANRVGGSAMQLDITDPEAPQKLAGYLIERHDGGDIIVHNAGITRDKTLAGMDAKRWDMVLSVNLGSIEKIDAHLLGDGSAGLKDGARIVCVSSMSGIAGNRGQTNYAASKAGLIGHVEALADAMAKRGGTINAVAPGFIETDMTAKMPFGVREVGRRASSLGQGGQPIDVAETIAFFSSPEATWGKWQHPPCMWSKPSRCLMTAPSEALIPAEFTVENCSGEPNMGLLLMRAAVRRASAALGRACRKKFSGVVQLRSTSTTSPNTRVPVDSVSPALCRRPTFTCWPFPCRWL